jgi:hypothetical protein
MVLLLTSYPHACRHPQAAAGPLHCEPGHAATLLPQLRALGAHEVSSSLYTHPLDTLYIPRIAHSFPHSSTAADRVAPHVNSLQASPSRCWATAS